MRTPNLHRVGTEQRRCGAGYAATSALAPSWRSAPTAGGVGSSRYRSGLPRHISPSAGKTGQNCSCFSSRRQAYWTRTHFFAKLKVRRSHAPSGAETTGACRKSRDDWRKGKMGIHRKVAGLVSDAPSPGWSDRLQSVKGRDDGTGKKRCHHARNR